MKTYGPYTRKDGRHHVIHYSRGKRTTESYPRFLWKQVFGDIPDGYEVDHKDGNPTNNSLGNLQLLTKEDNIEKSLVRHEPWKLVCKHCGRFFERRGSQERHFRKTKDGPYCSKSCVGKVYN